MHHGLPVLTDFDTADLLFVKTLSTQSMGSIAYAAPEQLIKKAERNPTGDIYSLGRLLHFFLIEDDPPLFIKESQFEELNSLAWPALVKVIRQCTMYSPKERYQSIDELLKAFRKALIQGHVVPDTLPRPIGPSEDGIVTAVLPARKLSNLNARSAFTAATVALVSLVIVVALLTAAYRYLSNGPAFAAIAGIGVFFLLQVLLFVGLATGSLSGSRFERLVGKLLDKCPWNGGPNDKGQ